MDAVIIEWLIILVMAIFCTILGVAIILDARRDAVTNDVFLKEWETTNGRSNKK